MSDQFSGAQPSDDGRVLRFACDGASAAPVAAAPWVAVAKQHKLEDGTMARSQLYQAGETARQAANAITIARGTLNGMPEIEQGIEVNGHANFVPSDDRGIAFARTPQQVLQIVYLTPKTGVTGGGCFPNGVNGDLSST